MTEQEIIDLVKLNHKKEQILENGPLYDELKLAAGGKEEYLIHDLCILIDKVYSIARYYNRLQAEILTLKEENKSLKGELGVYKKTRQSFSGHDVQTELVLHGKKIAYKEELSLKEIEELLRKGLSKTQVAERLGVSRGLICRRLGERDIFS